MFFWADFVFDHIKSLQLNKYGKVLKCKRIKGQKHSALKGEIHSFIHKVQLIYILVIRRTTLPVKRVLKYQGFRGLGLITAHFNLKEFEILGSNGRCYCIMGNVGSSVFEALHIDETVGNLGICCFNFHFFKKNLCRVSCPTL